VNIGAMIFLVLVVYALNIPAVLTGVPWNSGFKWESLNYSPLVLIVGVIVAIWWQVSAKNRYTGPVRTIDTDERATPSEPTAAPRPPEPGPPPVTPPPAPAS
jgi:hypothetical protein